MSDAPSPATSPAVPLRDAFIAAIRAANTGLDSDQIRAAYDVSGEPRDIASVIVACADLGGHNGMRQRILVDVRVTISVMTHLDEDQSGTLADSILSAIIPAIQSLNPALDGWAVRHITPFQTEESVSDGSFRLLRTSATAFTQNLNP